MPLLDPATQNPIIFLAFKDSTSVAAVLIMISDLQKRAMTEPLKNVGVFFTNLFLIVMVKGHPGWMSQSYMINLI